MVSRNKLVQKNETPKRKKVDKKREDLSNYYSNNIINDCILSISMSYRYNFLIIRNQSQRTPNRGN